MNQNNAPVGTMGRIGHPGNDVRIIRTGKGWLYIETGEAVDPEAFRAGWDVIVERWHRCGTESPPENEVVTVISPGGDVRELVFMRHRWWLPDRSMYVYFDPVFWREVA